MTTSNGNFIKFKTTIGGILLMLIYPFVILTAIITKLFEYALTKKTRKSVANEIAIITGSAHGLGKEIALELAKHGCAVAVVDVNAQGAESTVQLIRDLFKVPAKAYTIDVSDYEQVVALNESVCHDLGVPTILVNNAGIVIHQNPLNPSAQDIQRMINVNLAAHFYTIQVFLPKMKELNKGHIVAIASASAQVPLLYSAVYSSTKVAVRNLIRVLRMELKIGKFNIHTTTVCPFFLNTNDTVVSILKRTNVDEVQPILDGREVGRRIVDGMLRNEREILMPSVLPILYRMLEALPLAWMDAVLIAVETHYLKDSAIMEWK